VEEALTKCRNSDLGFHSSPSLAMRHRSISPAS